MRLAKLRKKDDEGILLISPMVACVYSIEKDVFAIDTAGDEHRLAMTKEEAYHEVSRAFQESGGRL